MPWPPVRSPCIVPSVRTLRVSPVSHRYVPDKASEAARSDALRFPSRTPRRTRPPSRQSPDCLVTSSRGRGLLKSERKVSDLAKGASMMCFATSAFSRLSIRQPSPRRRTLQIELAELRQAVLADFEGGEFVVWIAGRSHPYIPASTCATAGKSPAP